MKSVFSKIIEGVIPCYRVYEDEKVLGFLDIHPETAGHVLMIPKVEVDKIYDLDEENFDALMRAVKKMSLHMEKVLEKRILWKVIGTDVPHAHVHLMPFDESWTHGRVVEMSEEKMEEMRKRLSLDSK